MGGILAGQRGGWVRPGGNTLTSRKYKYRLDIDGFGWTARWRRQLSTGSVVFKASIYVSYAFSLPKRAKGIA